MLGSGTVLEVVSRPLNMRATSSVLLRLTPRYSAAVGDEAPATFVLKLSSTRADVARYGSVGRHFEREIAFYRQIGPQTHTRVPRCFSAGDDCTTGAFHLLLEDVSAGRRQHDIKSGMPVGSLIQAVRWLADLHAEWWGRADDLTPITVLGTAWDGPAADGADVRLLAARAGAHADADLLDIVTRVAERWPALRRASTSRTLLHGDFHTLNIFVDAPPLDSATAVDWQFCGFGAPMSELAGLLGIFSHPLDRRRHSDMLLRVYWDRITKAGVTGYPFADCLSDYRLELLCNVVRPLFMLTVPDVSNSGIVLRWKYALLAFEDAGGEALLREFGAG